ncbi:MAG: sulfotransferase [Pseudomonadales bacterium]
MTAALTQVDGVADFDWRERWHGDRELAGACVLAGLADVPDGRQVFQTTYLNASYVEYLEADAEYQLVWLIRNPRSVVRSMVYNWSEFSLAELFKSCGTGAYEQFPAEFRTTRSRALARLTRACASYVGKNEQLHELAARIPSRLTVISYDQLVQHPVEDLTTLCKQLGLNGAKQASTMLRKDSLDKHETLSPRERRAVDELCSGAFRDALALAINQR